MINREKPHLLMLPEDLAVRRIANGFLLYPSLNLHAIQLLPNAGGKGKVTKDEFKKQVPDMVSYPERRIVLLFDFDVKGPNKTRWCYEEKLKYVDGQKSKIQIPDDLKSRVFVLGVLSEPEELRSDLNLSLEKIGETLAKECADNRNELWEHELIKHNQPELERMISSVKPFLFSSL